MADLLPIVIIAFVMLLGFVGNSVFRRTNIPSTLWLMLLGLAIGPLLHIVEPSVFLGIIEIVAAVALIIILFEGGLSLEIYKLFREAPRGTLLAISGFTLTVIAATILFAVIGQPIMNGALLGAIIGGTSSPIVVPIISRLRGITEDTRTILTIDSTVTDALTIVASIAIMNAMLLGGTATSGLQWLASAFSVGAVFGVLGGIAWLTIMKRFEGEEFSYVLTLSVVFLLYVITEALGGNGAIAALAFGVVLANGRKIFSMIKYETLAFQVDEKTKEFHALIAFFVRTFFFVYIGLLVSIDNVSAMLLGLALAALVLAVRPIAVRAALARGEFAGMDRKIMSIMLPRGLAAAVIAYIPAARGIPGTENFVDIVFTVIVATTVICTVGVAFLERDKKLSQPPQQRR